MPVGDEKSVKNRLDIDLDPDDHDAEIARMIELGATPVDVGRATRPGQFLVTPRATSLAS